MQLTLLSVDNACTRISCGGDVTIQDIQSDEEPLRRLLGKDCYRRRILMDIENADYFDSAGIGWLVMSHKRCVENGGKLVLHSLPPRVESVLRLLNLHKVFHLAVDEAAAMAMLEGGDA